MITRCPACATAFRVVPDQLRVSDGWVRCGQCGEVFDAAADLHDKLVQPLDLLLEPAPADPPPRAAEGPIPVAMDDVPPPTGPLVPAPAAEGDEHTPAMSALPPGRDELAQAAEAAIVEGDDAAAMAWMASSAPEMPVSDPVGSMAQVGMPAPQDLPGVDVPPAPALADGVELVVDATVEPAHGAPPPSDTDTDTEADTEAEAEAGPDSERATLAQRAHAATGSEVVAVEAAESMPLPLRPAVERVDGAERAVPVALAAPRPAPAPVEPAVEVSFIREAPPDQPPWRRALQRALWVLAGMTLAGGLLLQVGLHERDRIAASVPAAKPWLQTLCQAAGCSVEPLRSIESIVIDDAAFSALRDDGYRLRLSLRNRAEHAVAVPAIELSLTDIQEQPVLRRVLLPSELGATAGELPARGEWVATVDIAVAENAGRARIVGYRVLPFYP